MNDVYLCHPRRSAIGRFGGALGNVRLMIWRRRYSAPCSSRRRDSTLRLSTK